MKRILLIACILSLTIGCAKRPNNLSSKPIQQHPISNREVITTTPLQNNDILSQVPIYGPGVELYTYREEPIDEKLENEGVQVPVPRDCRVINTKGNCVWCSLELLGRYAEMKELYNITKDPPLGDPRCQGGSYAEPVRRFLESKKIRYEMTTNRAEGEKILVKGCKTERRGVAFGIPGHMLNCIHYDPETKVVKVIDNADRSLSVQTWTWEKFHSRWDGWCYIIYGDPDIVPDKYTTIANKIPIIDKNGQQGNYDKRYIPKPKQEKKEQ